MMETSSGLFGGVSKRHRERGGVLVSGEPLQAATFEIAVTTHTGGRSGMRANRPRSLMSLLNLAPEIQQEILFLPRTVSGRDAIVERDIRDLVGELGWNKQRKAWAQLQSNIAHRKGRNSSLDNAH